MSIRYKIAIWFSVTVFLLLVLVGTAVYIITAQERTASFRNRLVNRARGTARIFEASEKNYPVVLAKLDTGNVATLYPKSIDIITPDMQTRYRYSDLPGGYIFPDPETVRKAVMNSPVFFSQGDKTGVALYYESSSGSFIIRIMAADNDSREYLAQLKDILLWSLLLTAVLTFSGGLLFAKRIMRPVGRIAEAVTQISANNLSERLPRSHPHDEFDRLAAAFNKLLDRLQESFAIQRRFISNASHELSTPLTSISNQLEVALQKDRTPEAYIAVLKSVQEDILDMQQLTRSLLEIARTGYQGSLDLQEVRIDEVLLKAIADIQKQLPYTVSVHLEDFPEDEKGLIVYGNPDLLLIALKNIIGNGCKYAENNHADVTARFGPDAVLISILNKGDVIAEADIQNIFQPFFRTAGAINRPGFGLGLTLARRILALHKSGIEVSSDPVNGTRFTIRIPAGNIT